MKKRVVLITLVRFVIDNNNDMREIVLVILVDEVLLDEIRVIVTMNLIHRGHHGEVVQMKVLLIILGVRVMQEHDGIVRTVTMNHDMLQCVNVVGQPNVKVVRNLGILKQFLIENLLRHGMLVHHQIVRVKPEHVIMEL